MAPWQPTSLQRRMVSGSRPSLGSRTHPMPRSGHPQFPGLNCSLAPCRVQSRQVELFLNCVWLVLGLSLLAAWGSHAWRTRHCPAEEYLPSRRLQFTALLLLIGLLFPVISVTDDFAKCTAPRENEQAMRLHNLVDDGPLAPMPQMGIAWRAIAEFMFGLGPSWPVEPHTKLGTQLAGTRLTVDSRPPPASL